MKASDSEAVFLKEIGFAIETTKDESPTLRLINGTERGGESMHHTGGAFSETCLIYGQAFKKGFELNANPVIVSLGLGLGYVEVLATVFAMLHNSSQFKIYSYESVPGLRKHFENFYQNDQDSATYQWILNQMALTYKIDSQKIRAEVKKALNENRLQLLGDFVSEAKNLKSFDVFCYDAYSKKTSPELWDEVVMADIFSRGSDKSCVSSYASNSALKTALATAGYQVEKLEGFQGKRNRTWAYRNATKTTY